MHPIALELRGVSRDSDEILDRSLGEEVDGPVAGAASWAGLRPLDLLFFSSYSTAIVCPSNPWRCRKHVGLSGKDSAKRFPNRPHF
jgi:hypothetical protein